MPKIFAPPVDGDANTSNPKVLGQSVFECRLASESVTIGNRGAIKVFPIDKMISDGAVKIAAAPIAYFNVNCLGWYANRPIFESVAAATSLECHHVLITRHVYPEVR